MSKCAILTSAPTAFIASGAALLNGSSRWLAGAGAVISGVLCVLLAIAILGEC